MPNHRCNRAQIAGSKELKSQVTIPNRRSTDAELQMSSNQTTNSNSIRSVLDKENLNGSNFLDWYRNLRIVLRNEQKLHHLEEALPEVPPATITVVVRNAYTRISCCKQEEGQSVSTYVLKMKAYLDQMERLGYLMPLVLEVNLILTSLSKDYDQFMQNYNLHGIGKTIPEQHVMLKLEEKSIPKKALVVLAIRQELKKNKASTSGTSGIFTIEFYSFPKSNSWIYDTGCGTHICNTIQRLRGIQKMNKGALDLYVGIGNRAAAEAMKSFDLTLPSGMKKGKGKSKLAYDPKHKIPPPAKKEHPVKDSECHHYHKTRHRRRNCPLYLAELKKNKASTSGTSGIFTIEFYSFPKSNSWIYDTGCGTHICNTIQRLRGIQKMNKGALDLYVGIGNRCSFPEAMKSFDLPSQWEWFLILQAGGELWKIWSKISKDEDLLKKIKITKKGKGKSKLAYDPKHKIPPPAKKEHPVKDSECHHYHKTRHRRRNCPLYLAELKKNKASTSGTTSIFTIEFYLFPKSNSWIYDTGCGTHICNTNQRLRGIQKMNKGALDLYVGIGNRAAAEAMKSFDLTLPSGMVLVLDNYNELKKNKASTSGTSGIFTIEFYSFPKSNSWIYNTGYGTHICNTIQRLRGIQKMNKGALDLYVGIGNRAAIRSMNSFDLTLPSE
ncbi:hypothetical protein Tco_1563681 [Tanacetum coccineum]